MRTREKLGPDHPDTLDCLHNLASVYHDQARETDAAEVLKQLLHHEQTRYGRAHWRAAITRFHLGASLVMQSKFADAEQDLLAAESVLAAGPAEAVAKQHQCVQMLFHLYQSWEKAEPGKGYGAKAARWQKKS